MYAPQIFFQSFVLHKNMTYYQNNTFCTQKNQLETTKIVFEENANALNFSLKHSQSVLINYENFIYFSELYNDP